MNACVFADCNFVMQQMAAEAVGVELLYRTLIFTLLLYIVYIELLYLYHSYRSVLCVA